MEKKGDLMNILLKATENKLLIEFQCIFLEIIKLFQIALTINYFNSAILTSSDERFFFFFRIETRLTDP